MSDLSRDLSAVKCHKDALVNIFNLSCFTYFIVSITESLGGGGGGGGGAVWSLEDITLIKISGF